MNSLVRHPVLHHLPLEMLRDPRQDQILDWLQTKRRRFRKLRILVLSLTPIVIVGYYLFRDVHSTEQGLRLLGSVFDIVAVLTLPFLAVCFYLLERQYRISEDEIASVISEFSGQNQRPT